MTVNRDNFRSIYRAANQLVMSTQTIITGMSCRSKSVDNKILAAMDAVKGKVAAVIKGLNKNIPETSELHLKFWDGLRAQIEKHAVIDEKAAKAYVKQLTTVKKNFEDLAAAALKAALGEN